MKIFLFITLLGFASLINAQNRWSDTTYNPDDYDIFNKAHRNKALKVKASGDSLKAKKEKNLLCTNQTSLDSIFSIKISLNASNDIEPKSDPFLSLIANVDDSISLSPKTMMKGTFCIEWWRIL